MEENKILKRFRYSSLFLTTAAYLMVSTHSFKLKVCIVCGLWLAAILIALLLELAEENKNLIIWIVAVETIGNVYILYVSGGLMSPYIWYCLNSMLLATFLLSARWVIGGAVVYASVVILRQQHELGLSFREMFIAEPQEMINIFLGLLLLTAAVVAIGKMYRQIREKNEKCLMINANLQEEKERTQALLDDIVAMYEIVHSFNVQPESNALVETLFQNIERIRVAEQVMIMVRFNDQQMIERRSLEFKISEEQKIELQDWTDQMPSQDKAFDEGETHYSVKYITYSHKCYGCVALQEMNTEPSTVYKLEFLLHLLGILFKKSDLEKMSNELIISQEQNRIANEIHDTVIQRLFASSCSLHVLGQQLEVREDHIAQEIHLIEKNIKKTMKELREAIYNLSWSKEGRDSFVGKIEEYIETMTTQHKVTIYKEIEGDTQYLQIQQKIALYRIICELINNGIRHGMANIIHIKMAIDHLGIQLVVTDDGCGFNYHETTLNNKIGLGIRNIHHLVDLLKGQLKYESSLGQGTKVIVQIDGLNEEVVYENTGS